MEKKHIFTALEKKTFLDILKKYSVVIENKQTDGSSLKQKNNAWERVVGEYNANPHTTQSVTTKQLRRLWMNIKQRRRDAISKQRQHRMATGGEPSADIDPDVAQITPELIMGLDAAIDSNTPASELIESNSTSQPMQGRVYVQEPSTSTAFDEVDTSTSYQPQTPLPPPPPIVSRNASATQRTNVILEKEYRDRQQRQNELHELQLQLLVEQIREARAKADLAELILHQQEL